MKQDNSWPFQCSHRLGGGLQEGFNVVLSDMCHSTTGNAMLDAARSLQLGQLASELALGEETSENMRAGGLASKKNLGV